MTQYTIDDDIPAEGSTKTTFAPALRRAREPKPDPKPAETVKPYSVKVEKGVPIPPKCSGRETASRYPFATMEVNDSFWMPFRQSVLYSSARNFTKTAEGKGKKFVARTMKQDGTKGARIWRVE